MRNLINLEFFMSYNLVMLFEVEHIIMLSM